MKPLSDRALERLREASELPDLSGTRFTLIRELGRGGMGIVYLVQDSELGREAALKIFHLDDVSPNLAARMHDEARTLAQLEHPGIVPIYEFGKLASGRLYYAMRYVQGNRLDKFLLSAASLPERLRVFERICEAVAFAHSRRVIHRDLKPSNIMLGSFGEVLVLDWCHVAGTPGYMAPEQERGEPADERSDVFALGRVLDEMIGPHAPAPLRSIVNKATASVRYETVQQLSAEVLRFIDGAKVEAHHETLLERWQRFYNRNQALVLLATAYVIMRFAVLIFLGR